MTTIALVGSLVAVLLALFSVLLASRKRTENADPIRAATGSTDRIKSILDVARAVESGAITPQAGKAAMIAGGYAWDVAELVVAKRDELAAPLNGEA